MKVADFDYSLPDELIARYPAERRSGSRLLCVKKSTQELSHLQFVDFPELLNPGDLLVFNDTRVIPARLFGRKESGGRVEILIERITGANSALCQIRASKSPKAASRIYFDGAKEGYAEVSGRDGDFFLLKFVTEEVFALIEKIGHMPLPPYIDRDDESLDEERYQTVYARNPGAVAAPTAGLHFDDAILARIEDRGVSTGYVTLHVGAGTFQPVRVEDVSAHQMHEEYLRVDQQLCDQIALTRARGGRVIAVGTTSVRSLETAANASQTGEIEPFTGETDIFIYPGYEFRCVDAMLTNFHLPRSTLLMLVSAFSGTELILRAYAEAVRQRYRFFSYGDAMLLQH